MTGIASNTVSVGLVSALRTFGHRQTSLLIATVTAMPGGGGVPSGTVQFVQGSQVLGTLPLVPTGVNTSSATLPYGGSGNGSIVAVYSGNSIAVGCCSKASPPGGGAQVPIYPSATSPPLQASALRRPGRRAVFTR